MALPRGCAKADNGFVFMVRTRDELRSWSDIELEERYRAVRAYMSPDAGLAFVRSYVRNVAVAERRALINEMARRSDERFTARERAHNRR